MRKLLSTKNAFLWLDTQETEFQKLKGILTSELLLKTFDPKLTTMLLTDASGLNGLSYALLQKEDDTKQRLITCGSCPLSETQNRYATIELKCLAIQYAISKCRFYLLGLPNFEMSLITNPCLEFKKNIFLKLIILVFNASESLVKIFQSQYLVPITINSPNTYLYSHTFLVSRTSFNSSCFSIVKQLLFVCSSSIFLSNNVLHATINMKFAYITGCQAFFMTLILICVTYYILYVELRRSFLFYKHDIERKSQFYVENWLFRLIGKLEESGYQSATFLQQIYTKNFHIFCQQTYLTYLKLSEKTAHCLTFLKNEF